MKSSLYDKILIEKRGFISKYPKNKKAVLIISGGLDSVTLAARLIEEQNITVFPLHIERGQTNIKAEHQSLEFFEQFFQQKYGNKFRNVAYIKLNVPPAEIKADITPYMKKNGHPLRDTMLQLAAVQYAVSLLPSEGKIETVFCAVMPEDYFPHSSLESIRATTIAACQNLDNWSWVISSPNIDPSLSSQPVDKPQEIRWAASREIPIQKTISCNDASEATNLLNCGECSSCRRRKQAFNKAGVKDGTNYFRK